jgi:hypothetical protein
MYFSVLSTYLAGMAGSSGAGKKFGVNWRGQVCAVRQAGGTRRRPVGLRLACGDQPHPAQPQR